MRQVVDIVIAALIPTLILFHLIWAPYTKVEESFNIQATHDILTYGVRDLFFPNGSSELQLKDHYDHLTFTGPVPRTSVGALTLATASWPVTRLLRGVNPQIIVRAVLGLWNAFCLLYYRHGVESVFGRTTANWFVLFQASVFHIMYYASRTLPNFFAFGLEPYLYMSRAQLFLSLVTATGVIFRSELALFLIPHTLVLLVTRRLSVACIITFGGLGALIGLSITVPIDSIFWQRFPLWPELSAFSYNILQSQSSNWGTSPWHFYFISALPRLLFNPITYTLCIPLAASQPALKRPVAELILPNLAFVALYSLQPHKEWRFIIYTIPPFLTAAALGANWIWTRRSKSPLYRLLSAALVLSVIASFAASGIMLAISRLNYPGANALNRLHALVPQHQHRSQPIHRGVQGREQRMTVNVHMGTLACMTGITRFQQQQQQQPPSAPPPPFADLEKDAATVERSAASHPSSDFFFIYDKTDDEAKLLDPVFWLRFDWALAEYPERVIGKWEVVETVEAYAGVRVLRPGDGDEVGGGGGGGGVMDIVAMVKKREWKLLERYARMVTGGWWVRVRMEPRISILKRLRSDGPVVLPPLVVGGDW
ncbi:MAG: hypothetical protein LQ339_005049 [Xanthoria mediterranea]|nr:MAG: hypothetical protein LQ339_005049 [Xanthoria mediterranea]